MQEVLPIIREGSDLLGSLNPTILILVVIIAAAGAVWYFHKKAARRGGRMIPLLFSPQDANYLR